jgi:hypothetical protein
MKYGVSEKHCNFLSSFSFQEATQGHYNGPGVFALLLLRSGLRDDVAGKLLLLDRLGMLI